MAKRLLCCTEVQGKPVATEEDQEHLNCPEDSVGTGKPKDIQELETLVWTADGRPRPAVTRTLQYAADIASTRNGQHLSAKSLPRRWKHEIQIALLRRRAAMSSPDSFSEGGVALRWHHRQGSAPLGTRPPLLVAGPATTTATTLRLTQPYLTTTMTFVSQQATRMNLCSHRVSNCPVYLRARE